MTTRKKPRTQHRDARAGKLTQTIMVRVSTRALALTDKARVSGLFERSRSEFLRDALEDYLKKLAVVILLCGALAAPAAAQDMSGFENLRGGPIEQARTLLRHAGEGSVAKAYEAGYYCAYEGFAGGGTDVALEELLLVEDELKEWIAQVSDDITLIDKELIAMPWSTFLWYTSRLEGYRLSVYTYLMCLAVDNDR